MIQLHESNESTDQDSVCPQKVLEAPENVNSLLSKDIKISEDTLAIVDLSCYPPAKCQSKRKTCILSSIFAEFKSGTINGIIGESGAGKSTILNILMQQFTGCITGSVLFNNVAIQDLPNFKHCIAYCRASERFQSYRTPYEILSDTAALRLSHLSQAEQRQRVNKLLEQLGLNSCRNSYVDGEFSKLISSSERKRLSVAQCLLTDAPILIFDEPTTSLDYLNENEVMNILVGAARAGKCIIAPIHRPSAQVFDVLDTLSVLSKGHLLYHGPAHEAITYFEGIGFNYSKSWNPSDFILDIANGQLAVSNNLISENVSKIPTRVFDPDRSSTDCSLKQSNQYIIEQWMNSEQFQKLKARLNKKKVQDDEGIVNVQNRLNNMIAGEKKNHSKKHHPSYAPLSVQLSILTKRFFWSSIRNPISLIIILLIQGMQSSILGLVFHRELADPIKSQRIDPLISDATWKENKYIDLYMKGIGDSKLRPFLSMFLNGIDNNGDYIFWNKDTIKEDIQNMSSFFLQNVSKCLYSNMDIPNQGYYNLTRQYNPVTTYENWDPKNIYSNLLAFYQIIDHKFIQQAFLNTTGEVKENIFAYCYKSYGSDVVTFYECILNEFKPHADDILPCLGLPILPTASIGDLKPVTIEEIPKKTIDEKHIYRNWTEQVINKIYMSHTKINDTWEKFEPHWLNDNLVDIMKSIFDHKDINRDDLANFLFSTKLWIARLTYNETPIGNALNQIYQKSVFYIENVYESTLSFIHISGCFFFLTLIVGFSAYDALLCFHKERILFNRETANHMYHSYVYFLAKNIADLPIQFLPSLVVGSIFYFLVGLAHSWPQIAMFYAILIMTIWCAYGAGYLISLISPHMEVAIVTAPSCLVLVLLVSGFLIRDADIPIWLSWLKYLSLYRWSYFSFVLNQYPPKYYNLPFTNEFYLSVVGVTETSILKCYAMIFLLSVIFRLISNFFLVKTNRHVGLEG